MDVLTCSRYWGWGMSNRRCTVCLDLPMEPSAQVGNVFKPNFTSTPGSLWLSPPLATWTMLKSPPIASGLNLVKNA